MLAALFPLPLSAGPRPASNPLIVLVEQDPWAMVIGSDSPRFALYDDGLVIFRSKTGFKSVKLSGAEMSALVSRIAPEKLAPLARLYRVSQVTDQPLVMLAVFDQGKRSVIRIYGRPSTQDAAAMLPTPVVAAYQQLMAFDHPRARDWLPEKIEVMIWPYDYAPDTPIVWPADWPGIDDPATVKRGYGYSLYVPSSRYSSLTAFLRSRKQKGAIVIGGRKWSASMRYPFPGEAAWMDPAD
jgi:hypothetical protein